MVSERSILTLLFSSCTFREPVDTMVGLERMIFRPHNKREHAQGIRTRYDPIEI
jgi:hypothetical protein